nr:S-layer homology domain-containing protein [Candidatus Ozemobacteraceae bacterium]
MAKMNGHASRLRPLVFLGVFFVGAIAGFFGENQALESASSVARIDVVREWARVLKILRPLLNQETFSSYRMPPFSDYPGEQDEMVVAVLGAGLMQGFADGRFQPERRMNRGEGALAAGRLEEFIRASLRNMPKKRERRPVFVDIVDGHWLFDALSRLGGIGALSSFGEDRFLPDQPLSGTELRSIGNSIIDYYGQDVAVIESMPDGLGVSLKPAIGELSMRDFRYCWAGGVWRMMPESGVIPWEERKSGGLLHIAAAEWSVTPTDVVPLKGHVWFAAVRRNTNEVIRERRGTGKDDAPSAPSLHLNETDEHTRKRLEAHLNALYAKLHGGASASRNVPGSRPPAPLIPDAEPVCIAAVPSDMTEDVMQPAMQAPVPVPEAPVPAMQAPMSQTEPPAVEPRVSNDQAAVAARPVPPAEPNVIQVTGCLLD